MPLLLPGHACRFYILGACFYPEAARPGYEPAYRCKHLVRLMERWDDFLDRAEAFGLSEETAGRIWNARSKGFFFSHKDCPAGRASPSLIRDDAPLTDGEEETSCCTYLRQGACLLALPRCEGICARYRRPEQEDPDGRAGAPCV